MKARKDEEEVAERYGAEKGQGLHDWKVLKVEELETKDL